MCSGSSLTLYLIGNLDLCENLDRHEDNAQKHLHFFFVTSFDIVKAWVNYVTYGGWIWSTIRFTSLHCYWRCRKRFQEGLGIRPVVHTERSS